MAGLDGLYMRMEDADISQCFSNKMRLEISNQGTTAVLRIDKSGATQSSNVGIANWNGSEFFIDWTNHNQGWGRKKFFFGMVMGGIVLVEQSSSGAKIWAKTLPPLTVPPPPAPGPSAPGTGREGIWSDGAGQVHGGGRAERSRSPSVPTPPPPFVPEPGYNYVEETQQHARESQM